MCVRQVLGGANDEELGLWYRMHTQLRNASQYGETLVVRVIEGVKALVDPCDQGIVVHVQSGRRARLIRFCFSELCRPSGRDTLATVVHCCNGLGFTALGSKELRVLLQDLNEGQKVDILPVADPAAAYAALLRPTPVLYGAVAVRPLYAAQAA